MKKLITLLLFLSIFKNSSSQAIWNWATSASAPSGSPGSEGVSGVRDNNGNFIVCGFFWGSGIVLGNYSLAAQVPSATPSMYVVKFSPTGTVLWLNGLTSPTVNTTGLNVSTDAQGNVYVTGQFSASIVVGTYTLTSNGSGEVFLIKYNSNGVLQWAMRGGGITGDLVHGICTDPLGNTYITGAVSSNISTWGTYTLNTIGTYNAYLIKVDPGGNVLWGTSAATTSTFTSEGKALALDATGNVYWTGSYNGSMSLGTITINSTGAYDYFLAKYSATGTPIWAVSTTAGSASEVALSVATDISGNPYIGGTFSGSIAIGTQTYATAVNDDAFIAKYNSLGVPQWGKVYRGGMFDKLWSISTFTGGLYVAGNATPNFTMSGVVYPAANNTFDDTFVEGMDFNGNLFYSNILNGGGDDWVTVYAIDECSMYLSGDYAVAIPTTNYTFTLPQGIIELAFLAKLTFPPHIVFSGNTICAGNNATITASGANTYTWSANAGASNSPAVVVSPAVNTVYSISATNQCGQSNATVMVLVNPNPNISITTSSYSVCPGNTVVLSAFGSSSVSWSNPVTNGIAFTPSATAVYSATATNTLNCSTTATVQIRLVNLPVITPAASATVVCPGQSVTLSAGLNGSYTWQPGGTNQSSIVVLPLSSQTYSVSKIDSTCVNTATIGIQVLPQPLIVIVSSRTFVCVGQNITLTANGASTYTWNTGIVSPSITASTAASTTLVYTATGTGTNGCTNSATVSVKVNACTGIEELSNSVSIQVFPNPGQSEITIELPAIENLLLTVQNTLGEVINEYYAKAENDFRITLRNYAQGVYFVSCRLNSKIYSKKIVVN
ncbi:MAG: T9SS type A sorting domain-containing protein [Bacteroidia bacterium]|nr:T9SS type A sorting domain-containing protein [Bacteroidia bacterium]